MKEKKKDVESKVTKKTNSLASGSHSLTTKRNYVTLNPDESYSSYDSSLASGTGPGSEDRPRDEPKPKLVSKLAASAS